MSRKPRLLIIEDEIAIRTGLIDVFIYHGYDVDFSGHGTEGLQKALSGKFDLILLDVMLPGLNGYEILKRIREQDREQAVIMLTAKSNDEDIIAGLTLGADDYVAKPFSVAQLVLRVQAVLRRSSGPGSGAEQQTWLMGADLQIDSQNLCARRGEIDIAFTRREMDILHYLRRHAERPVSREELLHKVWGYAHSEDLETRTVDIHIAKLRRKIETDPAEPKYLLTVRSAGYRLLTSSP
jgi:DNA-binding response OmpR family regulator